MNRKRILLLAAVLVLAVSLTACAKNNSGGNAGESTETEALSQGGTGEAKEGTFTGTMAENKGFMFIVEDKDGTAYVFGVDEEDPVDLTGISEGDKVTVSYTGTLDETSTDLVAVKVVKSE